MNHHLYHLIPKPPTAYSIQNSKKFTSIKGNHSFFDKNFFPSTNLEWNKLEKNICSFPSYKFFKKQSLECIISCPKSTFNVPNSYSLTS